jgi:hypothetical protein
MTDKAEFDSDNTEMIDALEAPVDTLQELYGTFLPTVTARIWETCCWPDRMAEGWKIGDYRFVVLSVSPDSKTSLYVQFWSEPREPVLAEVCSGEWSPRSLKYVQESQRRLFRSLGYRKGGQANNFEKEAEINTAAAAEEIAREALRIFFEAFGYRGQWPLEIRCAQGERAVHQPVFSSLTPDDFAKLLSEHGFATAVPDVDDSPVVLVRHGRRRFTARFDHQLPHENSYRAIVLNAVLDAVREIPDEAVIELSNETGLTIRKEQNRDLWLSMLMLLDGGVTGEWVLRSSDYWLACVRRCDHLLQRIIRKRRVVVAKGRRQVH